MKKAGKGCFGCFGIIGIVVVVGILGAIFLVPGSDKKKTETKSPSVTVASSNSEETRESSKPKEEASNFKPKDTSDATIKTIKTYGDYLDMYEYIMMDYFNYYQSKIEAAGLTDAETKAEFEKEKAELQAEFEKEKAELQAEFDKAEKEYGPMRHLPIPAEMGRSLTAMLIAQRDTLRSSVDVAFSVYGV